MKNLTKFQKFLSAVAIVVVIISIVILSGAVDNVIAVHLLNN